MNCTELYKTIQLKKVSQLTLFECIHIHFQPQLWRIKKAHLNNSVPHIMRPNNIVRTLRTV